MSPRESRSRVSAPTSRVGPSGEDVWPFTPYASEWDESVRMHMRISREDMDKIGRGGSWRAEVTDVDTGNRYTVRDASCGSPGCRCAAAIVWPGILDNSGHVLRDVWVSEDTSGGSCDERRIARSAR